MVSGVYDASMNRANLKKGRLERKTHLSVLGVNTIVEMKSQQIIYWIILGPKSLALRSAYSFSITEVIQNQQFGIMEFTKFDSHR